jgi:hypothetical protein
MKITIDTHYCSREELAELKEYLENKCWDFTTDEKVVEGVHKYELREDGIYEVGSHGVTLNEIIQQDELHEYSIIDRKDFIDELIRWISEAKSTDKEMMKQDLFMLQEWEDDYIFSSNSTNSYIRQGDSDFDKTCEELIEINAGL